MTINIKQKNCDHAKKKKKCLIRYLEIYLNNKCCPNYFLTIALTATFCSFMHFKNVAKRGSVMNIDSNIAISKFHIKNFFTELLTPNIHIIQNSIK